MRDLQTETIELSIGLVLVISQSNWRLSRKKAKLEVEAQEHPLDDPDDQMFALSFYPLLAGAVVSDNCPTVEECLEKIPESDLEAWYQTAKKVNPDWFLYMDAVSDLIRQQEEAPDTETKKEQNLSLIGDETLQEELSTD